MLIFWRTFEHGFGPAWAAVSTPDARHAFWLTLELAAIAVPLNTIFGVVCAIAIVRWRFRGKGVLNAWSTCRSRFRRSWSASRSSCSTGAAAGCTAAVAGPVRLPAMVLATIFVSLPFVVREVVPVLREVGTEQEQAARDARRERVADLPARDAARDPLGRRLRRRADDRTRARRVRRGERRLGPDHGQDVDADDSRAGQLEGFDVTGAYAASVVLALVAIATLVGHEHAETQGGDTLMAIEARNITKRFGDFIALDDVSLEVPTAR